MVSAVRTFYKNHIEKKLFNKILLLYSLIIVVSLTALAVLIYRNAAEQATRKELEAVKQVLERATHEVERRYEAGQQMVFQLYKDERLLRDVLFFLNNDFSDYLRYRLDRFADNAAFVDKNMDSYFQSLTFDREIQTIWLYSSVKGFLYAYRGLEEQGFVYPGPENPKVADPVRRIRQTKSFAPPPSFEPGTDGDRNRMFTMANDINDPITLQNHGTLLVDWKWTGMDRIVQNDRSDFKGELLLLTADGTVLYDSSRRFTGQRYPYMGALRDQSDPVALDEPAYVQLKTLNQGGVLLASIVPVVKVSEGLQGMKRTVIAGTVLCVSAAVLLSYLLMINFSRRTQTVIRAMRKLQDGDLSVRVTVQKEDELFHIATSFNKMCETLQEHIQRVYLSEIKQRQAELLALQAQIQPHFLYNTLEAIRLKAVMDGNRDVGDMIYSLGALFQNLIKHETMVTVQDEVRLCRLYLNLLRARYPNRFDYEIAVDEAVGRCTILKLTLQPIVENCIRHAFDGPAPDGRERRIIICGWAEGSDIRIAVTDNGSGIAPERLAQLRRDLEHPPPPSGASIGLTNVNERLKHSYGEAYGLRIDSRPGEGATVTVTIPGSVRGNEYVSRISG
ncbi:sensor histidine kinase [Paenibacillus ehimensis]|uniref:histidine kinase n=1 Tax=Paenibacillus ehimensis TaxID=79264 RepID=A0ABT8VK57_9BACL|nr:sensor histidine kinase [Paenibacillus ehimensis]MDO3681378.1 sensor histidine kinase [Paenibacillus ehimensis]